MLRAAARARHSAAVFGAIDYGGSSVSGAAQHMRDAEQPGRCLRHRLPRHYRRYHTRCYIQRDDATLRALLMI